MTDVEQRVVQMRFDDKEFDEKAKKTMKTLDKLSEKLSFDAVAQKSDAAFNEIVGNVEKIADKAYTIIDRVIDKIKDNIATKLVGFIEEATVGQVAKGWQKYADMTSAVGTLVSQGHKMEKVTDTLERLSFFADETSYSFNDMLSNIGKFTASGVKLEDAEESLMGIANWAAMSGQNAETASRVFAQLAQAMGTYMKKQDWASVQTANMDTQEFRQTALDTAVALGTLKKVGNDTYVSLRATTKKGAEAFTIEGFTESLTQGAWMTSEVMVETYKKYSAAVNKIYDIFHDEEHKGTVLTSDIINERKTINEGLIAKYIEMYNVTEETAKKELDKWTSVKKATEEEIDNYAKLNKISKEVANRSLNKEYYAAIEEYSKRTHKSIQQTEEDLEQWSKYVSEFGLKAFLNAQEARTFTDVINSVKESVSSAWRSIYTSIFGDYNEAKALWSDMADGLIDIFAGRMSQIAEMFSEWKGIDDGGRNTLWQGLYAFGWGLSSMIENVREAWDELITGGESGVSILVSISKQIQEAGFKFYTFMTRLGESEFYHNIAEALHNITSFISTVFGAFHDGVRDAMPSGNVLLNFLIELSSVIKDVTSNFKLSDEAIDGLRRTFKGLTIILLRSKKTFMDLLVKIILPLLNAVFTVLGQIVEVVVTLTGTIGDILEYFIPLDKEASSFVDILSVLTDILVTLIKVVGGAVTYVLKALVPAIGGAIGLVAGLADSIKQLFNAKKIKMGGESKLVQNFAALRKSIENAWEPLRDFSDIINEYANGKGLINFLNLFTDITEGIGNRLLLALEATTGFLEVMSESKFGKALSYVLKGLRYLVKAGLWLFNNLFIPVMKEIILELGLTIESVKGIIDERGIMGLLDVIQEIFKTGIFGKLVETIHLINGVIGGNGLGKLFNQGAKAIKSITNYFNAAKLNQASEALLKVVAAMGILYTLLALITFLPEQNAIKMKDAMLEFGIALGIVVGGVFVISAAAALAGPNLAALAIGFLGVAVAIATAFQAIKKMTELLDTINYSIIEASIKKLEEIMNQYAWIIIKTIGPMALLTMKVGSDIGGVGVAMAGLAVSIYVLLKTLEGINNVDISQMDKLGEFISGVYLVLAASTSLMIFAADGKNVHGIAIAIASVGVAFAAVKMILPLCKDIIAEQNVFIEGQAALATFGLFMLAFAASMYFITSGVTSILRGIAAILLFKAYMNIVSKYIIPAIQEVVNGLVVTVTTLMNTLSNGTPISAWIAAFVAIVGAIVAIAYIMIKEFRLIFDLWAEMDTISIIAIAATILGTMAMFANLIMPAIRQLLKDIKSNSVGDVVSVIAIILAAFSPVFAIMIGFSKVMDKYTELYGQFKNAKFSVNVGLITREFNGAASVMQSIMITVVGAYAAIMGIVYMVSKIDASKLGPDTISLLRLVFIGIGIILAEVILPLCVFFGKVMSNMYKQLSGAGNINRSFLFRKNEDTFTAVIRSLSHVFLFMGVLFPAIMFLLTYIIQNIVEKDIASQSPGKYIKEFEEAIAVVMGCFAIVTAIFGAIAGIMSSNLLKSSFGKSSTGSQMNVKAVTELITATMLMITVMFSVILLATSQIAKYNADEFEKFKSSLKWIGLILLGTMVALSGFVFAISKITNKYSGMSTMVSSAGGYTGISQAVAPVTSLLIAIGGLIGTLLVIGGIIIPQVVKLKEMELDKIIATFSKVNTMVITSVVGMIAAMALEKHDSNLNVMGTIVQMAKTITTIVGPMIAIGKSVEWIITAMAGLSNVSAIKMSAVKTIVLIIGIVGLLAAAITKIRSDLKLSTVLYTGLLSLLFVGLGKMFSSMIESFSSLRGIDVEIVKEMKWVLGMMGLITAIIMAVSAIAGNLGLGLGGILAVSVLCLAIGGMAVMIAMAAEKIYAIYRDWMGIQSIASKIAGYKQGEMNDAGLAEGITDGTDEILAAVDKRDKAIENRTAKNNETASPSKLYEWYGKMNDLGLARGITRNTRPVIRAVDSLAKITNSVFEDELGIASPSKVFYKNGRFIVAGVTEGVKSQKSSLDETMASLGESLSKSFADNIKMPEIDIWGGKDAEKVIADTIGNIDPSTIIGKMFGIEDENMYLSKEELDRYQRMISMGIKVPEEIEKAILSGKVTTKYKSIPEKLWDKVKPGVTSVLLDIGSAIGLDIQEGATGQDVVDKITDKLVGDNGIIPGVKDDIINGNWTEVGVKVGTAVGDGIKSALLPKIQGVVKSGKGLLHSLFGFFNDADTLIEERAGIGGGKSLYINSENLEDMKDAHDLIEAAFEKIDPYESMKEAQFDMGTAIDTSKFMSGLNEDFETRFTEFLGVIYRGIGNGDVASVFDKESQRWTYILHQNAVLAINDLMKTWGIASPSKVMTDIYEQIGEGGVVGIEKEQPAVLEAIKDANSEQYREMSLGVQALDELASGTSLIKPSVAPIFDASEITSGLGSMDELFGINSEKISASLNYTGSISSLANSQAMMASAVDKLRADILRILQSGELITINNNLTVNDDALYDRFVTIDHQKFNMSGRHAW